MSHLSFEQRMTLNFLKHCQDVETSVSLFHSVSQFHSRFHFSAAMATEAGADEVDGSADPSEHFDIIISQGFCCFPQAVRLAWGDMQCNIPKSL